MNPSSRTIESREEICRGCERADEVPEEPSLSLVEEFFKTISQVDHLNLVKRHTYHLLNYDVLGIIITCSNDVALAATDEAGRPR